MKTFKAPHSAPISMITLAALLASVLLSGLIISTPSASADCTDAYKTKIAEIDKFLVPARGTLISSGGAATVTLPALAAAGLLVPTAAITSGGAAVVGGSVYAALQLKRSSYRKVLTLYKQAKQGEGKQLRKLKRKLEARTGMEIDRAYLADLIIQGFEGGEFCPYDLNRDRHHPLRLKQVRRGLLAEFR